MKLWSDDVTIGGVGSGRSGYYQNSVGVHYLTCVIYIFMLGGSVYGYKGILMMNLFVELLESVPFGNIPDSCWFSSIFLCKLIKF